MIQPKVLLRLIHINWVLVSHGMDEIILKTHLFRPVRYLAFISPNYWLKTKTESRGVRIRRTLEDLGPIYVKFGQALSTRKDILPEDIANELVKLQDRVPPFSNEIARNIIEKELDMSISEAFAEFDSSPLASASVAQVHTAKLHTGENVIIKVLRPDIEKQIIALGEKSKTGQLQLENRTPILKPIAQIFKGNKNKCLSQTEIDKNLLKSIVSSF